MLLLYELLVLQPSLFWVVMQYRLAVGYKKIPKFQDSLLVPLQEWNTGLLDPWRWDW
jgi:hypothetical protein